MHEGCMCRWVIFEFSIMSPQAESHLEHQTIFPPSKCMFLCVDALSGGFRDFRYST